VLRLLLFLLLLLRINQGGGGGFSNARTVLPAMHVK
jgi:hypothetical protein